MRIILRRILQTLPVINTDTVQRDSLPERTWQIHMVPEELVPLQRQGNIQIAGRRVCGFPVFLLGHVRHILIYPFLKVVLSKVPARSEG